MVIETMWSPSASYANYGLSEESSYPGDSYVDIIAPTHYSPIWNPTRSRDKTAYHDWTSGQNVDARGVARERRESSRDLGLPRGGLLESEARLGLPAAIDFALAHSKRFALSETGTGNVGVTRSGGGPIDEGDYPIYLGERLAAAIAQGLELEVVEIWPQASGTDQTNVSERRATARGHGLEGLRNDARGCTVTAQSRERSQGLSELDGKQHVQQRPKSRDSSTPRAAGTAPAGDKQWIYVDLGQRYSISRVRLIWDAAYASEYTLQVQVEHQHVGHDLQDDGRRWRCRRYSRVDEAWDDSSGCLQRSGARRHATTASRSSRSILELRRRAITSQLLKGVRPHSGLKSACRPCRCRVARMSCAEG